MSVYVDLYFIFNKYVYSMKNNDNERAFEIFANVETPQRVYSMAECHGLISGRIRLAGGSLTCNPPVTSGSIAPVSVIMRNFPRPN